MKIGCISVQNSAFQRSFKMMSFFKNFKNVEKMRLVEKIKSVFYYQVLENFLIPNSCI